MDIEIDHVSISVPQKRIIDAATLHVDEGEIVGLIGPNGSGKSTLLKTVYRTMKKELGEIMLDGISLEELSLRDSAQKLAVVTQHNYFNFDFKVEEVVMMGRTPHKKSMEMDNAEDRMIVEDSLRKVDMLEMRERSFSSLSGGEQQRIILARALAQQTPCLVLDEPTNHLDIKYQIDILDVVKRLGCTTICAMHDLNLAAQYCNRIYVLQNGRIVGEGSPEDVITETMIQKIYGVNASVDHHPKTGQINVVYHSEVMTYNRGERIPTGSWSFLN